MFLFSCWVFVPQNPHLNFFLGSVLEIHFLERIFVFVVLLALMFLRLRFVYVFAYLFVFAHCLNDATGGITASAIFIKQNW